VYAAITSLMLRGPQRRRYVNAVKPASIKGKKRVSKVITARNIAIKSK